MFSSLSIFNLILRWKWILHYYNSFFWHLVHLMAHPRADLWWWLTRSCHGHKLLFRQPYLLWGVKGGPWITLRGPTLSKHWLLSDDRTSKRVRVCFQELAWAASMSVKQMCWAQDNKGGILTRSPFQLKFKYIKRVCMKIFTIGGYMTSRHMLQVQNVTW